MTRTRVPPCSSPERPAGLGASSSTAYSTRACRCALTHRAEAATLPANVEVVTGDLTVPESLDAGLHGVGAVFLVWTAPPTTAPAVVERLATYARRVVFLSSPHQTPHPFFQQPNPMAVLHADIERLIAAAGPSRRSSGRGCSRRTRCTGGRPRFAPTVSSAAVRRGRDGTCR